MLWPTDVGPQGQRSLLSGTYLYALAGCLGKLITQHLSPLYSSCENSAPSRSEVIRSVGHRKLYFYFMIVARTRSKCSYSFLEQMLGNRLTTKVASPQWGKFATSTLQHLTRNQNR